MAKNIDIASLLYEKHRHRIAIKNWPSFKSTTDTIMVATSPRIGVGPGFDSQGSVTLFHKYCFPNLYWIHWAKPCEVIQPLNSNNHVIDYHHWVLVEQKCSFHGISSHHSWGNQPQKSWCRHQTATIVDTPAECVEADRLWWPQWWMCNLETQYV